MFRYLVIGDYIYIYIYIYISLAYYVNLVGIKEAIYLYKSLHFLVFGCPRVRFLTA